MKKDYNDPKEQLRQHYKHMVRSCLKYMEAEPWTAYRLDNFVEELTRVKGDWITFPDMRVLVKIENRKV